MIYDTCDKYSIVDKVVQNVLDKDHGDGYVYGDGSDWNHGYPSYGNGYGGNYPNGQYYPPGAVPSQIASWLSWQCSPPAA
jgi:hypothetical protein